MVLEVYLDDLVAEPEHDGMSGPHPLLHVDDILDFPHFLSGIVGILLNEVLGLVVALEVAPEVLQKGDFLL